MKIHNTNKWMLNTDIDNLSVSQRRDALVLLHYLNSCDDELDAFEQLTKGWVDKIYKLPKTSAKNYNTVKTGRYIIQSRMRKLFDEFVVKAPLEYTT